MQKDYSRGRYNVYGYGPASPLIGRVDGDEYVRSPRGELLYRIDGDEVYDLSGKNLGFIEHGIASSHDGICIFVIREE